MEQVAMAEAICSVAAFDKVDPFATGNEPPREVSSHTVEQVPAGGAKDQEVASAAVKRVAGGGALPNELASDTVKQVVPIDPSGKGGLAGLVVALRLPGVASDRTDTTCTSGCRKREASPRNTYLTSRAVANVYVMGMIRKGHLDLVRVGVRKRSDDRDCLVKESSGVLQGRG